MWLHVCGCSYGYAPIVGVLVLLAAGAATGETIKAGIVGTGEFHPYGIVILFMSQVLLGYLRLLLCPYPGPSLLMLCNLLMSRSHAVEQYMLPLSDLPIPAPPEPPVV